MKEIRITSTLTGKKELFVPRSPDRVGLYVCGITPYDYAHIGHARVYVTFDLLYRLLQSCGYAVTYVRNFTDIDDKIIAKAARELGDSSRYHVISQLFIDAYHEDMKALNCATPTHEPRVTECIPEIIQLIEKLIAAGKAYQIDGDVYYSIQTFPTYGNLSKQKLDDLRAGHRIEVNDKKRDPLDFALWKGEAPGSFWKSPWGYGRPGWHIECSAMAAKYLGPHIDIHAGGLDLIFPHHENEIAQSEGCYGPPFARYWMHNGFVTVNQEKMSKSLGNFFTLRDVFKQFDPMVIRYYILAHHYKAPLEFSIPDIQAVQKSYQRLCKVLSSVTFDVVPTQEHLKRSPIIAQMMSFACDDLNTPGMFGVLFENLSMLQQDLEQARLVKYFLTTIAGFTLQPLPEKEQALTPEIEHLIKEREHARAAKDWVRADRLRDELKALGYDVQDQKIK
ncbi:MAG: cysteine--tRNA ligase [Candidatus Babeliales bacterium]